MNVRDELHDIMTEHGDDIVRQAIPLIRRVVAMVARGKARRVTIALDQAHASLDETLAERIKRGEGHQ